MVYMYHSFLINSSADGHLGSFPVSMRKQRKNAKIPSVFLKGKNLSSFTKLRPRDMFVVFRCIRETYFLKACHLMCIQM